RLARECGEPRRRGFWASWPQAGAPAGTVLAAAVITVLGLTVPAGSFETWGWRIAFLLAAPLLAIGFWIRRGGEESPGFHPGQENAKAPRPAAGPDTHGRPRTDPPSPR